MLIGSGLTQIHKFKQKNCFTFVAATSAIPMASRLFSSPVNSLQLVASCVNDSCDEATNSLTNVCSCLADSFKLSRASAYDIDVDDENGAMNRITTYT